MNSKQIEVGKTYAAKVSGKIVLVTVLARRPSGSWSCRNTVTQRIIRVKSAQRFQWKAVPCVDCGKFGRWCYEYGGRRYCTCCIAKVVRQGDGGHGVC